MMVPTEVPTHLATDKLSSHLYLRLKLSILLDLVGNGSAVFVFYVGSV